MEGDSAVRSLGPEPRPPCKCHSVARVWEKDPRTSAGGFWRCHIKRREKSLRWRNANLAKAREDEMRWYHAPNGGWYRRRKRDLAAQRDVALQQLDFIQQQLEEVRRVA